MGRCALVVLLFVPACARHHARGGPFELDAALLDAAARADVSVPHAPDVAPPGFDAPDTAPSVSRADAPVVDPDGGPIEPIADAADALDRAWCARLVRCFHGSELPITRACHRATRRASRRLVEDGRVTVDLEAAATCVEFLEGAPCALPAASTIGSVAHDALLRGALVCDGVFVPVRRGAALGEPCAADPDCAAPYRCETGTGCAGRCAPAGAAGDACDGVSTCGAGLVCDSSRVAGPGSCAECSRWSPCDAPTDACVDGRCGVGRGEGDLCERTTECAVGLSCRAGRCRRLRGRDEVCDAAAPCDVGLACGPTGRCEPSPIPGICAAHADCPVTAPYCTQLGECANEDERIACTRDVDLWVDRDCPPGTRCGALGRCVALAGPGERCAVDADCEGSRCEAGRCVALVVPWDACDATHRCTWDHVCREGACDALPILGEPCGEAGCLDGVCVGGRCEWQSIGGECFVYDSHFECEWWCRVETGERRGTCAPPPLAGERCGQHGTCASPLVCSRIGCQPACEP